MSISIENNSWDYVQRLIEREINSAFKLRIKENKKEQNDIAILMPKDAAENVTKRRRRKGP